MLGFAGRMALRYLRTRRRERFVSITALFSVLGIMLGVATLILVLSLMNGIKEEMISRFLGIGGDVTILSNQNAIYDYEAMSETLATQDAVVSAVPRISGQVMVNANDRALGAQVLAQPLEALLENPVLAGNVTNGDISRISQASGMALGQRLAENLGVRIGDMVTLISPEGQRTFAGMIPRIKAYPVVATIKTGMHLYDSSLVLLPIEEGQKFFKLTDAVNQIELDLVNSDNAVPVAIELQQSLGSGYRVYDWQTSNSSVFNAITVQRNVMVTILALIVLVAAFNIISSLVMLVQDKQTDIAILRTLGATRSTIMRIFMISGVITGFIGTAIGCVLGVLAATYLENIRHAIEALTGQKILVEQIYFLSSLPTKTEPSEVIMVVIGSLTLSFLATLYPAWKAAKIQPAEALRYG